MDIGEIIKSYRKQQDISQREFALKCGLSNGSISLLEKGINPKTNEPIIPSLPTLNSIANGMGIKIDNLLEMLGDVEISLSRNSVEGQNIKTAKFVQLYESLSEDKKHLIMDIMEGFLENK